MDNSVIEKPEAENIDISISSLQYELSLDLNCYDSFVDCDEVKVLIEDAHPISGSITLTLCGLTKQN